jgi:hypothetical protein
MSTNAYKLFRDLLPSYPLQVGDVVSTLNGVATISLAGGGVATARYTGSLAVNTRVFFKDNAVEGVAPNLPLEIISI